jgi:hypothetical protein
MTPEPSSTIENQRGSLIHPAHQPEHRPNEAELAGAVLSHCRPPATDGTTWPWVGLPYFLGAILANFLLVLAIQYGSGYYNPISLKLLAASVALSVLLIPALFLAQSASPETRRSGIFSTEVLILFAGSLLILEIILGLQDVYLHYNQNPLFPQFAKRMGWINVFLVATYLLDLVRLPPSLGRLSSLLARYRFVIVILLSLILRIASVFASHIHFIDVGIMMQESSANLLAGRNPYTSATGGHEGFVYLPLHLLLTLPFYVILGDTRFGAVAWELVGIGFIYLLAKRELAAFPRLLKVSELALLIFVLQPRSLFVIEQAWGEPLVVGAFAASLYFFHFQPRGPLADVWVAATVAVKQYLIFICLPLFILYHLRWKRYATTALAFGLMVIPFALWNPFAFYKRNVLHFFQLPIQTNSLGLTAYFLEHDILIPRWISPLAAGFVVLGLAFWLKRFGILGYLHTLIIGYFALFLIGQQAFANYYYLIAFFQATAVVFFIVYHTSSR